MNLNFELLSHNYAQKIVAVSAAGLSLLTLLHSLLLPIIFHSLLNILARVRAPHHSCICIFRQSWLEGFSLPLPLNVHIHHLSFQLWHRERKRVMESAVSSKNGTKNSRQCGVRFYVLPLLKLFFHIHIHRCLYYCTTFFVERIFYNCVKSNCFLPFLSRDEVFLLR